MAVDAEEGVGEGVDGDRGWEVAHGRVVADEMDEVVNGRAGVVDGDDLEVGSVEGGAEDVAAWEGASR